jgi:hypothetical protein
MREYHPPSERRTLVTSRRFSWSAGRQSHFVFSERPPLSKALKACTSVSDNAPRTAWFQCRSIPLHGRIFSVKFFSVEPTYTHADQSLPAGHRFDAETVRLLGIAFEMAIVALQQGDGIVSPTRDAVAQKIIACEAGERDPERLCDGALNATQPMAPVLISDPSPLLPPASRQAPLNS